ncbi:DUF2333 family protein [Paraglaciecola psychrophila]|jgi:hypothetical protein|uniref:DUF2333 domain-containing protein n=1 Tax=Paraglaciecola psychrophila 170 TaxID=1129794 RepID=K7A6X8_9ALTE|nr:DUF2333 family protein [Paraglaciecola psychrophila]AGH47313.1 hypothetical protein C427_5216 [Paraglaciecola psychrophila 170]GAC36553.1 hypothetical protein GPSY_0915 [Paraglaciecola psychrophila 170]
MKQYLAPKWLFSTAVLFIFLLWILSVFWSFEPELFEPELLAQQQASQRNETVVAGYTITTSLIKVSETLLNKSGGYLSNDVLPPSVMMDNMPSWEFGALEMTRDLALAMRQDFSRSQSQSLENPFLTKAQPQFNIDSLSWLLPSAESKYQEGIDNLYAYRSSLSDSRQQQGQFYARADNLRDWLKQLEKRLGSFSQRLSASVGQERLDTSLAGDSQANQSTPTANRLAEKTSWWQLDDNFYEARGASWALIHFLKAVEVDFADVLEKKNAKISLQQIIRELEATQESLWSPIILNGSGFGTLANHSLVMANYISRANAALIELSELLNQG